MTIDAVVFDIGNVLIEWNPERYYDALIGEDRRRAMFAEVDLHAMNDGIDRGDDFLQAVQSCAASYPQWRDEILRWHDNWLQMATPPILHSVRLLRALRTRGVPTFALTNFGKGTWDLATPAYPFLEEFDRHFITAYMGVAKPDPEAFAILERDTGIAPERLIFTDDRADNIATAEARGWRTHHFTGPQGWADRLVAEGLLSEAEAT